MEKLPYVKCARRDAKGVMEYRSAPSTLEGCQKAEAPRSYPYSAIGPEGCLRLAKKPLPAAAEQEECRTEDVESKVLVVFYDVDDMPSGVRGMWSPLASLSDAFSG